MYMPGNRRIVSDGSRLTFTAEKTGSRFILVVKFVAGQDELGRSFKGVKIATPGQDQLKPGDQAPFPQGAKLVGSVGETFRPDDDYILPKGHNECSVTDVDGDNYGLFSVELVDQGEDGGHMKNTAGGVLYFHDERAIPPELGGRGILADNPRCHFE